MILLGDPISAEHASELGLVTGLFEPGGVLEATIDLAKRISWQSSSAVGLAKEAICRGACPAIDTYDYAQHMHASRPKC